MLLSHTLAYMFQTSRHPKTVPTLLLENLELVLMLSSDDQDTDKLRLTFHIPPLPRALLVVLVLHYCPLLVVREGAKVGWQVAITRSVVPVPREQGCLAWWTKKVMALSMKKGVAQAVEQIHSSQPRIST